MKLLVDNGAILAYRRLSYRPWYAIAEFVDNSTDAYFRGSNRKILDKEFAKAGERLEVEVTYDKQNGTLRIADNSMGMSESELESAMVIGRPPTETGGRSEFGMGMKTSAIWFADHIEIRSKKMGEPKEVQTTIKVQEFIKGNNDLSTKSTTKEQSLHYTVIELKGLKRRLGQSSLEKTRRFLGSIYRQDLRDGLLHLSVNGQEIEPPPGREDDAFMVRSDGTPLRVDVHLKIGAKSVTGWIGVLKPGYTGRNQAGIALIRHGRAVRGWLDSWRPEEIFGDARNDTLNQRLAGELIMDDFTASHTKDAIDWEDNDEEELGEALKALCAEYDLIREAKKKTSGDTPEENLEKQEAAARLKEQLESEKVTDAIKLLDVPRPELARVQAEPLLEAAESASDADIAPLAMFDIGNGRRAILRGVELSPNDPYFEFEVLANADLKIVVNEKHPALALLSSAEARLAHFHHVVLDAVAEWKCAQLSEPLVPESIRLMKDRLFRAVAESDEGL
jgi:hypothetical protein